MFPPLLGVEDKGVSSSAIDYGSQNASSLKEQNYLGLSDCSSVDSSAVSNLSEEKKNNLNMTGTELRLGLPGPQSPEREPEFCLKSGKLGEMQLFPLLPSKDGVCSSSHKTIGSGNKRGFSDTLDEVSGVKSSLYAEGNLIFCGGASAPESSKSVGQGNFAGSSGIIGMQQSRPTSVQTAILKEPPSKVSQDQPRAVTGNGQTNAAKSNSSAPAAKEQVVGWPPIRSYRKNTLATTSKNIKEVDGKPGPGALFVKVSMGGAPYLRKIDLRTYTSYPELSTALEKMFSCFTIGQCGSHGTPGREMLSESKLKDILHGSEYVLTYEDKDDDWMLVGDVPWEMFISSCKRLKIMKGSDAIGLAPRAMEK